MVVICQDYLAMHREVVRARRLLMLGSMIIHDDP
jgi:hypothetical protein